MNHDTVCLLRECASGIQMAVRSLNDMQPGTSDARLRQLLADSRQTHERLGNETQALLRQMGAPWQDAPSVALAMSRMKTGWKLMWQPGDEAVADLVTDGCDMGVKTISRCCNRFPQASGEARRIARSLIETEQRLTEDVRQFL